MLEKLQKDFCAKKVEVDNAEAKAVAESHMLMQEKTYLLKRKNEDLDDTKKEKEETQEAITKNSEDLIVVAATFLDDQEYLMELAKMCSDETKTWDARSKMRADELSALTSAIDILEGKVSEKTSGATVRFAQQAMRVKLAVTAAHWRGRYGEPGGSNRQRGSRWASWLGLLGQHVLAAVGMRARRKSRAAMELLPAR